VRDIVLDEDVYVFALQSEGKPTKDNLDAARFIDCLQRQHRWVWTCEIEAAYRRHFARRDFYRGPVASQLMKHFNEVIFDQARSLWIPNPPRVAGKYHDDDAHMVSAAAAVVGSVLVTSDDPLSRALRESGLAKECGFEVLDFPRALTVLC
jgi:hypothetical protein